MTLCTHHFLIETPRGPTCLGVCRKCGETRTFVSAGEDDRHDYASRRWRTYEPEGFRRSETTTVYQVAQ
jgi:hypothetical protein